MVIIKQDDEGLYLALFLTRFASGSLLYYPSIRFCSEFAWYRYLDFASFCLRTTFVQNIFFVHIVPITLIELLLTWRYICTLKKQFTNSTEHTCRDHVNQMRTFLWSRNETIFYFNATFYVYVYGWKPDNIWLQAFSCNPYSTDNPKIRLMKKR